MAHNPTCSMARKLNGGSVPPSDNEVPFIRFLLGKINWRVS